MIGSDMSFLLAYVLERNHITTNDIVTLTNKSFEFLSDKVVTFEFTSYTSGGIPITFDYKPNSEKDLITLLQTKIQDNCDYILNLPFIDTIDFALIRLITSIRDSGYFWDIDVMSREENFVLPRYADNFKSFFNYYKRLKRLKRFTIREVKKIREL